METFIFIASIAWLIAFAISRRNASKTKTVEMEKTLQTIYFGTQYPEMQRAIDEAMGIISRTKNIETGIQNFAAVRSYISKIAALSPGTLRMNLFLNNKEMCREIEIGSADAEDSIKRLEKDWIRATSLEKIEFAMKQSEETSGRVMRTELVRDALRSALKGLEYIPDDEALKIQADLAERLLKFLT